jgi:hypothetical protein
MLREVALARRALPCCSRTHIRGGTTDQVQHDSGKVAIDILADYLDGKGIRNRVV